MLDTILKLKYVIIVRILMLLCPHSPSPNMLKQLQNHTVNRNIRQSFDAPIEPCPCHVPGWTMKRTISFDAPYPHKRTVNSGFLLPDVFLVCE